MMTGLPKFSAPPVVEVLLGVQFAPLAGFTTAHAGWYWREYLGKEWTALEAARIDNLLEQFAPDQENEPGEGRSSGSLTPVPAQYPNRIQLLLDQQLIQVQDTCFIYNWVGARGVGRYPSYDNLVPGFSRYYQKFSAFVHSADLGTIKPNQWEITYVNHVEQGQLWQSAQEWQNVIAEFCPLGGGKEPLENFRGEWHFLLVPGRARLRVSILPVRILGAAPVVLRIMLTARGLLTSSDDDELMAGFDLGHEAIVRRFADLTTAEAHVAWGRTV
jgi:uncharacterized protein (TIGR04255 family)